MDLCEPAAHDGSSENTPSHMDEYFTQVPLEFSRSDIRNFNKLNGVTVNADVSCRDKHFN